MKQIVKKLGLNKALVRGKRRLGTKLFSLTSYAVDENSVYIIRHIGNYSLSSQTIQGSSIIAANTFKTVSDHILGTGKISLMLANNQEVILGSVASPMRMCKRINDIIAVNSRLVHQLNENSKLFGGT